VAGRDIAVNASVTGQGAGKSLDLVAGRAVTMAEGTALTSNGGDIAVWADTGAIAIDLVDAGAGRVSLRAATTIGDLDVGATDDSDVDVLAAGMVLRAGTGVGSGAHHLETSVGTLSATVGAGGLFVSETADLTVDRQTVTVQRVAADGSVPGTASGSATVTLQDLTATGSGTVVVDVASGSFTLQPGSASTAAVLVDSGALRLASGGSLTVNGAVLATGGGAVSLLAGGAMTLANAGSVTASGTADVQLQAGGALTMGAATALSTGSGTVRVASGGLLTLGQLTTGGAVVLQAASVVDAGSGGGDTVNVSADRLRLTTTGTAADQGAGTGGNRLEITVAHLAADVRGGAGLFLAESDGLRVDGLAAIGTALVGSDGTSGTVTDAALDGLASAGALSLATPAGSLVVTTGQAVSAGGALLLAATAADGQLDLAATVGTSQGALSLLAGGALTLGAAADLTTAGGSIDLQAGGALTMASGTEARSQGGAIRLAAGGDLVVGRVDAGTAGAQATWGNVSLLSSGGNLLDSSGDASGTQDVRAQALRLQAAGGVGNAAQPLQTEVALVAAQVGAGGLYLDEASAVTVGATPAVTVQRVAADGTTVAITDAALSDLAATGGGSIDLGAGGTVTLTDGGDGDGSAVGVTGTGTVTIRASSGDVQVQSGVGSESGTITVQAAQGTIEVDDTLTTGSGDVVLSSLRTVQWGSGGGTARTSPDAGGTLTLSSYLPTQDIVIGRSAPATPTDDTWYFDQDALARLASGYDTVLIGGPQHTGRVTLDGSVAALNFAHPVHVQVADGGSIALVGAVSGVSLQVDGNAPVLLEDASITMREAAGIAFDGEVQLRGEVVLQADRLQFGGGSGSVHAETAGAATLALRPLDASQPLLLGSGAGTATGWQLDDTELAALGADLARLEIGVSGASGAVQVLGTAHFASDTVLWGSALQMAASSHIAADGDLTLVVPGGAVVTTITAAGQVTLQAVGDGALVRSALAADALNVRAARVVLEGLGPVAGSGTAPLRVDAASVDVYSPSGMAMRQTLANGDVRLVAMVDGVLREQLTNVHGRFVADARPTVEPVTGVAGNGSTGGAGGWGTASAWAPATAALGYGLQPSAGGLALVDSLATTQPLARVARLATADVTWQEADDGADLDRAFLLGAPASQPLAAGSLLSDAALFDYWVDNLTL